MAVSVLDRMRFVGLTECFSESAQLFIASMRARLGREHRADWPTVTVTRTTADTAAEVALVREEVSMLAEVGYMGYTMDFLVYSHAVRLFARRLREHNISVRSEDCARVLDTLPLS